MLINYVVVFNRANMEYRVTSDAVVVEVGAPSFWQRALYALASVALVSVVVGLPLAALILLAPIWIPLYVIQLAFDFLFGWMF